MQEQFLEKKTKNCKKSKRSSCLMNACRREVDVHGENPDVLLGQLHLCFLLLRLKNPRSEKRSFCSAKEGEGEREREGRSTKQQLEHAGEGRLQMLCLESGEEKYKSECGNLGHGFSVFLRLLPFGQK